MELKKISQAKHLAYYCLFNFCLLFSTQAIAEIDLTTQFGIRDERHAEDRLPTIGIAVHFNDAKSPLRTELALLLALDPVYGGHETEINLGGIYSWRLPEYRTHFALGIASLTSNFGYKRGSSAGGYIHGGFTWQTGSRDMGLDLRWLVASDLNIDGVSYPIGYTQFSFISRWKWR